MSTLGGKIDRLHKLREEKRALEAQIKEIVRDYDTLEIELIAELEAAGLQKSTGRRATASLTTSIKPNIEDWEAFYKYIHRHKFYHLLERRPSVTGCRELLEQKGKIPGVIPYHEVRLNLRNID